MLSSRSFLAAQSPVSTKQSRTSVGNAGSELRLRGTPRLKHAKSYLPVSRLPLSLVRAWLPMVYDLLLFGELHS